MAKKDNISKQKFLDEALGANTFPDTKLEELFVCEELELEKEKQEFFPIVENERKALGLLTLPYSQNKKNHKKTRLLPKPNTAQLKLRAGKQKLEIRAKKQSKMLATGRLKEAFLPLLKKVLYLPAPKTEPKLAAQEIITPKAPEPLIVLEKVDVIYNLGKTSEFHALKNINVKIYPGEFIVLFGPSGCGKSTLMNVIAGLERPCHGTVTVGRDDILKYTFDQLADYHTLKLGMVFQAYNLIDSLSIEDNIALPQMFSEEPLAKRKERVAKLLERFGIAAHGKKHPAMLSGGQQQRVGIARSLVNDPPLILADEPVGNLDSKSAEVVLQIFYDLNKQDNKTIVMVTHNPEHLHIANRIYFLKDGEIIKEKENVATRVETAKPEAQYDPENETETNAPPELKSISEHLKRDQSGLHHWMPLKAKIVASRLLDKFAEEQTSRIETIIKECFAGKLGQAEAYNKFKADFSDEGAGLDEQTAQYMSKRVEELAAEFAHLQEFLVNKDKAESSEQTIIATRQHLLNLHKENVGQENVRRLDKFILLRLQNKININDFIRLVAAPLEKSGAGFNKRVAKNFAAELDLLAVMKAGENKPEI